MPFWSKSKDEGEAQHSTAQKDFTSDEDAFNSSSMPMSGASSGNSAGEMQQFAMAIQQQVLVQQVISDLTDISFEVMKWIPFINNTWSKNKHLSVSCAVVLLNVRFFWHYSYFANVIKPRNVLLENHPTHSEGEKLHAFMLAQWNGWTLANLWWVGWQRSNSHHSSSKGSSSVSIFRILIPRYATCKVSRIHYRVRIGVRIIWIDYFEQLKGIFWHCLRGICEFDLGGNKLRYVEQLLILFNPFPYSCILIFRWTQLILGIRWPSLVRRFRFSDSYMLTECT